MLWKDSRWLVCSTGESLAMSLRSCVLVNLSFNSLYAAFPEKRVFLLINVCCLAKSFIVYSTFFVMFENFCIRYLLSTIHAP